MKLMKDGFIFLMTYFVSSFVLTPITDGGEGKPITKINPNKRHSKNNTIIGWNLYEK